MCNVNTMFIFLASVCSRLDRVIPVPRFGPLKLKTGLNGYVSWLMGVNMCLPSILVCIYVPVYACVNAYTDTPKAYIRMYTRMCAQTLSFSVVDSTISFPEAT